MIKDRAKMRGVLGNRASPALIVAMIALVAALAGSAVALPGKNSVDKNDIKKNAVKSKAIKNGQVKAADLADGSVKTGEIADGAVGSADLAPAEPFHNVGAAGEPPFSNGDEGDCIRANGTTGVTGTNPVGFYKDPLGHVHLRGIASVTNGAGGDASCVPSPAEIEDGVVFTLPEGYRPEGLELAFSAVGTGFIVPTAGATLSGIALPPGSVFSTGGPFTLLDGISFRAATPAAAKASGEPVEIPSLRALKRLAR